jgi:cell wall assembly regulator SMI1
VGHQISPATDAQIAEVERHVGPLPLDFRSYLQLHNGHADHSGGFYGYQPLLSCESMINDSKDLLSIGTNYQEIPLHHEGAWFHPGCLIFEEQDGGGYVINATTGVIYRWDHDGGPLHFLAESFTEMLKRMVRNLETGDGPTTSFSKVEMEDLGR